VHIAYGPADATAIGIMFSSVHLLDRYTISILVLDRYCASVSTHSLRYSIGEDISVCVSPPMPSNRTRRLKHMVRVNRM